LSSHHLFFLDFSSASKCHIKICKSTRKYCNIRVSLENESIGYWYWYWYFQYFQNAKKVLKYWVFLDFFTSIGIEYWILLDEYWFIPWAMVRLGQVWWGYKGYGRSLEVVWGRVRSFEVVWGHVRSREVTEGHGRPREISGGHGRLQNFMTVLAVTVFLWQFWPWQFWLWQFWLWQKSSMTKNFLTKWLWQYWLWQFWLWQFSPTTLFKIFIVLGNGNWCVSKVLFWNRKL
jgi:hypothetical protein